MAARKSSIPPGSIFGYLTVVQTLAGAKRPVPIAPRMECRCICGSVGIYNINEVKRGRKWSCGCIGTLRTCMRCGSKFETKGKTGARQYCSTACRFWSKVDVSGGEQACWPWKPSARAKRRIYGSFLAAKCGGIAQFIDAHRMAWELSNGPVPHGLMVLHRCDNPVCCNPAHFFLGTNSDNIRDAVIKGRARWGSNPSGRYTSLSSPS